MLIVAPATSLAGPDLDRHGLAGEHRLVDRRGAVDDDAVGGDLLAGPDDEEVADRELVDGDEHLDAVAQHAGLLRAELEQRADRLARAALGAGLEEAAEQDQRRDHGADLEVRVGVEPGDEHDGRPVQAASVPIEISVSIVAARWRAFRRAARWNGQPGPEHDGRRERERDPLPAAELERRHHGEQRERRRQGDRHDEPAKERCPVVTVERLAVDVRARSRRPRQPRMRSVDSKAVTDRGADGFLRVRCV